MVIPTVELCVKYIIEGENPEIRVLALVTLREALSRQWNIFFPADTSEAYVTKDPNQVIPDSPLFRRAIEGILFALTDNEPGVVDAALTDMEMMDSNRRLFTRPAFRWTEVGPSTIKSLFGVLMARIHTAYADRIRFLLSRISETSDGMFIDHFLPQLLKSQMHLTDEERKELQEQFGRPTDAQSFNTAADALTNDIAYYAAIRRQTELP
uniref:Exportin-1 C-terminal domain-containing protein n=1 Tax=Rhodosorus marinus TaxID=101924 RepID=A0A7S0BQW7_9RHOD|mmetsp:Transcript_331/g.367  ORF Transcript_331/g.367 Transcript_331/m.367 type:complete len:210 (+) Transcript_331:1-630(+)